MEIAENRGSIALKNLLQERADFRVENIGAGYCFLIYSFIILSTSNGSEALKKKDSDPVYMITNGSK